MAALNDVGWNDLPVDPAHPKSTPHDERACAAGYLKLNRTKIRNFRRYHETLDMPSYYWDSTGARVVKYPGSFSDGPPAIIDIFTYEDVQTAFTKTSDERKAYKYNFIHSNGLIQIWNSYMSNTFGWFPETNEVHEFYFDPTTRKVLHFRTNDWEETDYTYDQVKDGFMYPC